MRLSPELEAACLKLQIGGTTVNPSAFGGAAVDLSPPADGCDEKEFDARMVKVALELGGWERTYHTRDSRKSEPGMMDRFWGRKWGSPRLIVAELKVLPRKATADQLWWLDVFRSQGVPAYLWYPHDWPAILTALKVA